MADPTLVHLFKIHPFGKDICDATVLENGRRRTCTRPRAEHFEEGQLEAELGRLRRLVDLLSTKPDAADVIAAACADDYLTAHLEHHRQPTDAPSRPSSAVKLGAAWVALLRAVQTRRDLTADVTTNQPKEN